MTKAFEKYRARVLRLCSDERVSCASCFIPGRETEADALIVRAYEGNFPAMVAVAWIEEELGRGGL